MGNVLTRQKTNQESIAISQNPLTESENQLRPLYLRLKNLKDRMGRFEPTVGYSWDELYRDAKAVYEECSKLLSSSTWNPVSKEREAITSLKDDTGNLVDVLKPFYKRRSGLTLQKIVELNSLIEAERRGIEPLIEAFEEEIKSKTPEEEAIVSRWIAMIKRFGSSVRRVGLFLGKNARLEASLVTSIMTGNVVGAVIEGVELATNVYTDVRSRTNTEPEAAAITSESSTKLKVTTSGHPIQKVCSTVQLADKKSQDSNTPDAESLAEAHIKSETKSSDATTLAAVNHNTEADQTTGSKEEMTASSYVLVQTEKHVPELVQPVDPSAEFEMVAAKAPKAEPMAQQNQTSTIPTTKTESEVQATKEVRAEEAVPAGSDQQNYAKQSEDQTRMSSASTRNATREFEFELEKITKETTETDKSHELSSQTPPEDSSDTATQSTADTCGAGAKNNAPKQSLEQNSGNAA